ncbi:MAG: ParA family protein [Pirellulales bacterium]|nr:ParA family protein [Pirellulales bacterium]
MSRVVCIANQKGGVGKTTTAINLAVALARGGRRTLLVDLDPQCNATSGLGLTPSARHPLVLEQPLHQAVMATATTQLELLPGSRSLPDIARLAAEPQQPVATLQRHLRNGLKHYDFVLLDCPPTLGELTRAALAHASEVLMPIQCEYFAMEGLTQMIEVIRGVMNGGGCELQFGGILLTMFDPSLELTYEVEREVREFFGEIVFRTVIPRDVRVCEAPSHGQAVLDYAPRSRGTRAYLELCQEVLRL